MGLDDVERAGAKRHLRDFRESSHTKKRKVPRTVADAFESATELVNQEAPTDAGPSDKLVSVKYAFATAQVAAKEAKDQLASLQQEHGTLEGSLLAGSNTAQAAWMEEAEALLNQPLEAENNLEHIRLTEAERVEKLSAERDASSARLRKVFAALRRIIKACEKKKDKAINILNKAKGITSNHDREW